MLARSDWRDASTALSVASVIVAPMAVALPAPLSTIILAASVGLANAAVIAQKHGTIPEAVYIEKP